MKMITAPVLAIAVALAGTAPAMAASDYYLKIEGVEGEAAAPIAIESWSWGQSNPSAQRETKPRDAASGLATGKRMHKPMMPITAAHPDGDCDDTDCKAASGAMTHGDPHVDTRPGFAELSQQDSVSSFSLVLPSEAVAKAEMCAKGKHFPSVVITAREAVYEMSDVSVASCTSTEASGRQTQGATFGEKSAATTTVQLTGSMKHQKTGHVTLLK